MNGAVTELQDVLGVIPNEEKSPDPSILAFAEQQDS